MTDEKKKRITPTTRVKACEEHLAETDDKVKEVTDRTEAVAETIDCLSEVLEEKLNQIDVTLKTISTVQEAIAKQVNLNKSNLSWLRAHSNLLLTGAGEPEQPAF